MKDGAYVPYHLVLEELFSPCEGGVTGFDAQGNPVLESLTGSHAHEADLAAAHTACLEYAEQFCAILGEYAQYAVPHAPGAAMDVFRALLNDAPFCNAGVFKNIVFPDPVYRRSANSLEKKLEIHLPCPTVFSGTGVNNPRKTFVSRSRPRGGCRIGMHLHLYHAGVAHEIRNPLSSIKGYATYFGQRFPEGSDDREAAAVMVREVDRLNRVITDLIGLSRPSDVRPRPA